MTDTHAKHVFATLMQVARRRPLTSAEKTKLIEARQVLRRARRPAMNRKPVPRQKAKRILHHGKVRGQRLTPRQRRFFGARVSGYPVRQATKRNPRGERIGRIVEIRYKRDVGAHRGLYRHTFRKNASVYCLADGSILIR